MTSIILSVAHMLHDLKRRLFRCARDERGVSAVEFGLLLPLMVTLYLGGVEVSQGLTIDRKVTLVARTVTDLAAQATGITADEMTNILEASTAVMLPYSASLAKVTISQVSIDADGNATVDWSKSKNGTEHTKGEPVTLPEALNVKNTSLIWGEVTYTYKPVIGYMITGPMDLKDQMYMRPRLSDTVKYPAPPPS